MNVAIGEVTATIRESAAARQIGAIYYMHPLLAGPVESWPRHFARVRQMGFDHILLAPPFSSGRSGNIFAVADHCRLHQALGGGPALPALRQAVSFAHDNDLGLMLDVVVDRVACESHLADGAQDEDAPPDPRGAPHTRFVADIPTNDPRRLQWWQDQLLEWLDAGITGFRCDAVDRAPASVWSTLIGRARETYPTACFVAWTLGMSAASGRALTECGFDFATSSSWAWDYGSDWLDVDTALNAAIGNVLAMPELPFGPRLAATQTRPDAACRRALSFASQFGSAWLMPMGFELGARAKLDPYGGCPSEFDDLLDHPPLDLARDVAEANAKRMLTERSAPASVISSPHAPVAALIRTSADQARLLLVNSVLDKPVQMPITSLLPRLAERMHIPDPVDEISLDPGEVRAMSGEPPQLIVSTCSSAAVAEAIRSPRIAIEAISPSVDGGAFPAKRQVGERVTISASVICDGHETLAAVVLWRPADAVEWREIPMVPQVNDLWTADLVLDRPGRVLFTIEAWRDEFGGFLQALSKRLAASAPPELDDGVALVSRTAEATKHPAAEALQKSLSETDEPGRIELLLSGTTVQLMRDLDPRPFAVRHAPSLELDVDRERGTFASWYELFPRSQSGSTTRNGTFDDVIARLPAVRDMGFDVLYFPPIHPIGTANRKGRNNALRAQPGDPGSPYAIGSPDGGHDAIHPELGTLDDFRRLQRAASEAGLEIALDFAIQCSPDHPWLREHPQWFAWRADGTIRYAENPPKKYEDIVNVDFYAPAALPSLWTALRDIVLYWVNEGVRIFRVDNPHTKPLPFWAWLIADIRAHHPDVIFLAEAFTRPKMMYRLAKIGFSQSYTYFTWRDSASEMRAYLTELTTTSAREFFRPHFFVNTPDINPTFLHDSGRPGFLIRAALAALLSGLWGVYSGFELCEAAALNGREEYQNSEKYEIRAWDWDRPGNIIEEIRQLNRIRHANPALHTHQGIQFLDSSDADVLCFVKSTPDNDNVIFAAISFDPRNPRRLVTEIPLSSLGLPVPGRLIADDLMRMRSEIWDSGQRTIDLEPGMPFAIWRLRREV